MRKQEKFWSKVDKTDNCWNWEGSLESNGYGAYYFDGKKVSTHRYSYQLYIKKPLPKLLVLLLLSFDLIEYPLLEFVNCFLTKSYHHHLKFFSY